MNSRSAATESRMVLPPKRCSLKPRMDDLEVRALLQHGSTLGPTDLRGPPAG